MPNILNSKIQKKQKNGNVFANLLILACSQRKIKTRSPTPAIHLYDGVNYRVLRKVLCERGWPVGLQIKIISAKYGLIDATTQIESYEQRLDKQRAKDITSSVIMKLSKLSAPESVFVNLGKDYLPAISGIEDIYPGSDVKYADGPIGRKMQSMRCWLNGLCYQTASVKGYSSKKQSYLYFFPDWDDFIYEPFTIKDKCDTNERERTYAHQICGKRTPFDGILLSLANLLIGKGALHRTNSSRSRINLRKHLQIPAGLLLFGDCGAFSYANESNPLFTPEQAAELYQKYGFDIGASVDHIPLSEIIERSADGILSRVSLPESVRNERMYLTRDNAEKFLTVCKQRKYDFVPLGVIQGIGTQSYVDRLHDYLDMGYNHIAIGGLVPRTDKDILNIICAVRHALQLRTGSCRENIWIHLFGILRPRLQPIFRALGISSFDSASYFRKSWLRSDQNYLSADGSHWYGSIRIPISTSKAMRLSAEEMGISEEILSQMERSCLDAIEDCNHNPVAKARVIRNINQYGPLLKRKGEDNHFADKHELLLNDRPWEKCSCPFCRSAGIHVIVFRGASRNKRRGLHNTWVFYHKIMRKGVVPNSFKRERT